MYIYINIYAYRYMYTYVYIYIYMYTWEVHRERLGTVDASELGDMYLGGSRAMYLYIYIYVVYLYTTPGAILYVCNSVYNICVYIYTHIHTYTHAYMHTYIYIYIYIYIYTHMRMYIYIYIETRTHMRKGLLFCRARARHQCAREEHRGNEWFSKLLNCSLPWSF